MSLRHLAESGSGPINLDQPGTFLHWSIFTVSVANLALIAVMVVIFGAALLLPFPKGRTYPAEEPVDGPLPGTGPLPGRGPLPGNGAASGTGLRPGHGAASGPARAGAGACPARRPDVWA